MKPCTDCTKYSSCVSICDRIKPYINKDTKYQREIPLPEHVLEWLACNATYYTFNEYASYFNDESVNFPFLTPLQNRILYYFHFKGHNYKKIAIGTGKSSNVVKQQLSRARVKIRNFLSISRKE